MYADGDVDSLHCGNCKHFSHVNPCQKRIDHKTVRFAIPWFKCYDGNQHSGIICSDFEPSRSYVFLARTWRGFDYYWPRFVEQWGKPSYVSFVLDGDTDIRYRVRTEDFVYGNMFVGGQLNAYERAFYVRDRQSPTGYRLVTQAWDAQAFSQIESAELRKTILHRRNGAVRK